MSKLQVPSIQRITLSTSEAAQVLGMCKNSLDRSRITGTLFGEEPPAFIRYGRAVRYPVDSLNAWLEKLPRYKTLAEHEAA